MPNVRSDMPMSARNMTENKLAFSPSSLGCLTRRKLSSSLNIFPKLELSPIFPTTLGGVTVVGSARRGTASEGLKEAIRLAQVVFPQENALSCSMSRIAYVAAAGLLHDTTSHI